MLAAHSPTNQAPEDQLVQVQAIGQARAGAAHHLAPPDGEQGFEPRVDEEQERVPGCDHTAVLRHQQERQHRHQVADEVGAAIAQKDQPARPVPEQKAEARNVPSGISPLWLGIVV